MIYTLGDGSAFLLFAKGNDLVYETGHSLDYKLALRGIVLCFVPLMWQRWEMLLQLGVTVAYVA